MHVSVFSCGPCIKNERGVNVRSVEYGNKDNRDYVVHPVAIRALKLRIASLCLRLFVLQRKLALSLAPQATR